MKKLGLRKKGGLICIGSQGPGRSQPSEGRGHRVEVIPGSRSRNSTTWRRTAEATKELKSQCGWTLAMTPESIRKRLDDIGGAQIIQGLVNSIRDLGFILNVLRNHYNKTHQNYFTIILTTTYIQRNIDYWTFYLWRNVTCSHRTETLNWQFFFLSVFYWPWDQVPDHPLKSKGAPAKCFETPLTVSCPLRKPRNKTRRDISIYTQ